MRQRIFGRARPPAEVPAIAATAGEYSSDEILAERIAAGDKLAMQVLFARHRGPVYRWLYRFVGNETVAEDLLSDVFFDVWQQADRFEGRSAVSTWLLSIARFKALSARRRRTHAELDEVIEATVATPQTTQRLFWRKSTRARCCGRLDQALARTPRDHRPRLLSREVGGRSGRNPRHSGRHREDPYVLCPQEAGCSGSGGIKQRNQPPRRRIEGHNWVGHVHCTPPTRFNPPGSPPAGLYFWSSTRGLVGGTKRPHVGIKSPVSDLRQVP